MADYYSLIARAVAELSQNTETTRRALYARARIVLVAQLRGRSRSEIMRERNSLEVAIGKVEGSEETGKIGILRMLFGDNRIRKRKMAKAFGEAVSKGDLKTAESLFNAYPKLATVNYENQTTALADAVFHDHDSLTELLLTNGADPNSKDKDGWPLLHRAIANQHSSQRKPPRILELLLAYGAEVNAKNQHDETPLWNATGWALVDAVALLLSYGANVNAGKGESTPLHCAIKLKAAAVTQLLIANEADVNARDEEGDTPLHLAVVRGPKDVVLSLLGNKADVHAKNKRGRTPLHLATTQYSVELLIANKADVHAQDDYGNTPLHIAVVFHEAAAPTLIANKADVNARNNLDNTPLHEAVSHGEFVGVPDMVKMLIENKADLNAENKGGLTPISMVEDYLSRMESPDSLYNSPGKPHLNYSLAETDSLKSILRLLRQQGESTDMMSYKEDLIQPKGVTSSETIILEAGRSFCCLMREPRPGDALRAARKKFNDLKHWFSLDRRRISSNVLLELAVFADGEPAIALSGVWPHLESPGLPPDTLDGWDLFSDGAFSKVRKTEYLKRRVSVVENVVL